MASTPLHLPRTSRRQKRNASTQNTAILKRNCTERTAAPPTTTANKTNQNSGSLSSTDGPDSIITNQQLPCQADELLPESRCCVTMDDFDLLKVLGTGAYGKVFLVRKTTGHDQGRLYAMKVLRKEIVAQKTKTLERIRTERKVLESIRNEPFLVTMHYAFQTKTKLHLILDYVNGGELFTHLYQRDYFKENDVRIYVGELILALEKLHKVSFFLVTHTHTTVDSCN